MKFKLHAVREGRAATENEKAIPFDEKDIIIAAPTCCEAVVIANKQLRDYLVVNWEAINEDVSSSDAKRVKLSRDSFKSETEWKAAQMTLDSMDFDAAIKLVEIREWKLEPAEEK